MACTSAKEVLCGCYVPERKFVQYSGYKIIEIATLRIMVKGGVFVKNEPANQPTSNVLSVIRLRLLYDLSSASACT